MLRFIASYPFTPQALDYVKSNNITLQEVLEHKAYETVRSRAIARIMEAIDSGAIADVPMVSDSDALREYLSFIICRMVISCVNSSFLIRRYAVAEGKRVGNMLQREAIPSILSIARALGIEAREETDELIRLHFTTYLRYTHQIRAKEWKLTNQPLHNGFVDVDKERMCRIVEEGVRRKIESELPLPVDDYILSKFEMEIEKIKKHIEMRRGKYDTTPVGELNTSHCPPCILHLLGMSQAGENVPHSGRFALTTFLHGIGLNEETIMNMFSSSPDFDGGKTKYQVEHITGKISGTIYTPPSCATMQTYGLCINKDELCSRVSHPLQYYRMKRKIR